MAEKMDVVSSSPESSGEIIVTPKEQQTVDTTAISPPDSQQRSMPLSATGSSLANSNGKRPIQTISNGNDEVEGNDHDERKLLARAAHANLAATAEMTSMGNGAPGKPGFSPTKTHPSGYTWREQEQEPGYAWTSKKAQDEYKRAADQMVHKESAVRGM